MATTSYLNKKSKQCWHNWVCKHCSGSSKDKSAATRRKILMAAFDEIYHRGFQAASLNNILKNTDTTKGALYHHFKNKMELGYAVVDDVIYETIKVNWIEPLNKTDDPVKTLQQNLIHSSDLMTLEDVFWVAH
jgi:AcrR family transcriptional regulator